MLSLTDAKARAAEKFFFDTNIWIYIHGPFANPADFKTREYSDLYSTILRGGGEVFISLSVASEFINRYIKILCEAENGGPFENGRVFKEFRQSEKYAEFVGGAADDMYHILSDCRRLDTPISDLNFDQILKVMASGKADFNDIVVAQECVNAGLLVVTHDRDFAYCDCEVATANPRLLRSG